MAVLHLEDSKGTAGTPHKMSQPPAQSCWGQSQGPHFFSRRQERAGSNFLSCGDTPAPKLLLILTPRLAWAPGSSGSQRHEGGFNCPDLGDTHGLGLRPPLTGPSVLFWCPPAGGGKPSSGCPPPLTQVGWCSAKYAGLQTTPTSAALSSDLSQAPSPLSATCTCYGHTRGPRACSLGAAWPELSHLLTGGGGGTVTPGVQRCHEDQPGTWQEL